MLEEVIEKIKKGGVGAMPTDTIFGIVASALVPDSVNRIYREKARPDTKPFVIIISDYEQLALLDIELRPGMKQGLEKIWPAPISVLLPCPTNELAYLHRGTHELAVRIPDDRLLREFLQKTGPLVATSANLSGFAAENDIADIRRQLPGLDFYIDGPTGQSPSTLARIDSDGTIHALERG